MIPNLRRIRTTDDNIRQLQDAADEIFKVIVNKEILDGQLLSGVELVTGSLNRISHKLGRKLVGYLVTSMNANTNVWDSQTDNVTPGLTLDLNCGANVTINLWVF